MADPPGRSFVASCAIIFDHDSFSLVGLALPVAWTLACWTLCLLLIHCSTTRREWRKAVRLAKKELAIVQRASMDVSMILFFPAAESSFASWLDPRGALQRIWTTVLPVHSGNVPRQQDSKNHHHRILIPLLQRIQSPCNDDSFLEVEKYQEHRLHVLGCALWFRFHVHDPTLLTYQALADLVLASQPPPLDDDDNNNKTSNNNNNKHGLSFMNQTLEWAILPMDRPMIRYCLDALAWALRAPNQQPAPQTHNLLPGDTLTLLLDCILQRYYEDTTREELPQQEEQRWLEDPEELTEKASPKGVSRAEDASGNTRADDESEGILPLCCYAEATDKGRQPFFQSQAKRVFGYLRLLGVFLPSNEDTDNDSEFLDENDQQHDKDNDKDRTTPVSYFRIRPGILQEPRVPPPHCAQWTQTFATRLLENVPRCSSSSSSWSFYCHNLPSLLIHLGCYAQASQLLHTNQHFATDRWQTMGLKRTVEAFVSEWEWLDQCMRLVPESMGNTSPTTIQWLCAQTSAIASNQLDPTLSSSHSNCRPEVAQACYQMGIFAVHHPQSVGDHQATHLLQDGRRLQLLVLEAACRLMAKSIHNLGITLHVRESFQPKNPKKIGANPRSASNPDPTLPSTKCFGVSQQLLDAIAETCQDYKDHTTETTIAEVATCLCQALVKGWRELQPSLHDAVSPDPTDGAGFRTKRVIHQWHQSNEASHLFADFQVALCSHLPCSEAQGTATNDFLNALSDMEGIL